MSEWRFDKNVKYMDFFEVVKNNEAIVKKLKDICRQVPNGSIVFLFFSLFKEDTPAPQLPMNPFTLQKFR